jgi:hypothetical protein
MSWLGVRLRGIGKFFRVSWLELKVRMLPKSTRGRDHGEEQRVVVSLTSYPPRFRKLALTLRSLLSQSVAPDAVVLWIAAEDIDRLPRNVLELRDHGLTIAECEDLGSYKKIIPALERYPADIIVTVDDDYHYPQGWLEALLDEHARYPEAIICHAARQVTFDGAGAFRPYREWPTINGGAGMALLPTGFGGVLYPPGSLPEAVRDRALYMALAPTGDDLWLRWMTAGNGLEVRVVNAHRPELEWRGSQRHALVRTNLRGGGNDRQIANLARHFGVDMFHD